jgi:hypothetical protein
MFSRKLTDWRTDEDNSQLNIETFFKNHTLLNLKSQKNPFNGFLIDFEFLFLKKNYSLKIKENIKSPQKSNFFISFLGPPKPKVKTKDMKGMVSSTVFTLNQSVNNSILSASNNSESSRIKSKSVLKVPDEVQLEAKDKNPLLLDYIVKYSKG